MLHTVIIPHANRERRLQLCLRHLEAAAYEARYGGVEALIVSESPMPDKVLRFDFCIRTIVLPRIGKWFNKPRLQNVGIENARGDVLTFLDCDSLVGERFFEGAHFCLSPRVSKVWYRVRTLAQDALDKAEADPEYIRSQFDAYDTHAMRFEAHQLPDMDIHLPDGDIPSFGNSQFSIAREKLGDLRADEKFEGAGFEDIAFNLAIWRHFGKSYRAVGMTDADHAILDIQNTREEDWFSPEQHTKNGELYRSLCPWNDMLPE